MIESHPSPPAHPPLLSFAIPTYQNGAELPGALDSILNSPRSAEIEIIVSNNASTDGTAGVLDGYAAAHHNIHALHQPENVSFDENLARAIERCSGRYVWTMSSDDVLLEDALDRILDTLARLPAEAVLIGNWWIADQEMRPLHLRRAIGPDRWLDSPAAAVPSVGLWALFMSILILPTDRARAELHRYRSGEGLTHWKVGIFLAATGTPVLELGAPLVMQRRPDDREPPYYDVPVVLSADVRSFLTLVRQETGLSRRAVRVTRSLILRRVLKGFVLTARRRWPTLARRWFRPLLNDYWSYGAFWVWIVPQYLVPRPVVARASRVYTSGRRWRNRRQALPTATTSPAAPPSDREPR